MKIQTTRLAAAAATTILALSSVHAASAQSFQNPDCSPVTLNSNLNPGLPPDWVYDPITQKWLAPNSVDARRVFERHDACLRSLPDYQQRVYQENLQRAYENQQSGTAQYQGPYRQDQQNNNSYRNGQNNRDYQNNGNYQNGRDGRNGRNDDRRDAFDAPRDRGRLWQQRYSRVYTTDDDNYYQNCTGSYDPAGVIAGAVLGGLLGNSAGRGNSGATIAGIIVGGAVGGSLTRNLSCEDRSYSYKTYYNAFNAGHANQQYEWRNPRNGRRGVINIGSYYNDPDGFRCATFSQMIYIQGRPQQARGRACQQPDGIWAIVG